MNQTKDFIGFEKTINLFQGLFTIFYWMVIIGMVLVLGMMIGGILVPPHTLDILTAKGGTIYLEFNHSSYQIDVNHIQNTKIRTLIINVCIIVEVILAILLFITVQIKRILQFTKNKQPFSKSCIKHIQYLAYGVIMYGFIIGLLGKIFDFLFVRRLQVSETIISLNFNFEIMILGFLLLFLSHIFKYGAYLQEEYDSTL